MLGALILMKPLKEYFPGGINFSIPLLILILLLTKPCVYLFATFNFKVFSPSKDEVST